MKKQSNIPQLKADFGLKPKSAFGYTPAGIFFTIRTRFLPIRMLPEMLCISIEKRGGEQKGALTGVQALIVSTATRVGMGNMVGVVAAVSAGGAGAVFWMWVTALIGASTAYVEAVLAQIYKEPDPLYEGYRGGPAYYIQKFFCKGKNRKSIIAVLFAISGLICWCGVSQVISNSVTSSFHNAFGISPVISTVMMVALAAVIVLRKMRRSRFWMSWFRSWRRSISSLQFL